MKIEIPNELIDDVRAITKNYENQIERLIRIPVKATISLQSREITCSLLQSLVCQTFGVLWKDIMGNSKKREHVNPRMAYLYLCEKYTTKTQVQLGSHVNRDRSSVSHASSTIKDLMDAQDAEIFEPITYIETQLKDLLENEPEEVQN